MSEMVSESMSSNFSLISDIFAAETLEEVILGIFTAETLPAARILSVKLFSGSIGSVTLPIKPKKPARRCRQQPRPK